MSMDSKAVTDGVVITGLLTATAWSPWLDDLNKVLTTASLVIGLVLAVVRIAAFLRRRD
jgi:hypothetical protein